MAAATVDRLTPAGRAALGDAEPGQHDLAAGQGGGDRLGVVDVGRDPGQER
jgi:hypothetical protein